MCSATSWTLDDITVRSKSGYRCSYCLTLVSVSRRKSLDTKSSRHEYGHSMTYCCRCDRCFVSDASLEQHLGASRRHNICYRCDKDFETWEGLIQHYLQSYRHFYCQQCNAHFHDDDTLEEHLSQEHDYCFTCLKVRSPDTYQSTVLSTRLQFHAVL